MDGKSLFIKIIGLAFVTSPVTIGLLVLAEIGLSVKGQTTIRLGALELLLRLGKDSASLWNRSYVSRWEILTQMLGNPRCDVSLGDGSLGRTMVVVRHDDCWLQEWRILEDQLRSMSFGVMVMEKKTKGAEIPDHLI